VFLVDRPLQGVVGIGGGDGEQGLAVVGFFAFLGFEVHSSWDVTFVGATGMLRGMSVAEGGGWDVKTYL